MLAIVGLIVAFVLIAIYSRPATRGCRWRRMKSGDTENLKKFRCAACGEEAYTRNGAPPKTCLKGQARGL